MRKCTPSQLLRTWSMLLSMGQRFHHEVTITNYSLVEFSSPKNNRKRTAEGSTSMHFHPFCFHFPCGKDYEWQESTKSPLEISALLGSCATDWSWSGDRWRWIWWVGQDLGYGYLTILNINLECIRCILMYCTVHVLQIARCDIFECHDMVR